MTKYGYVGGNPLSFVDPEGLQSVAACANPANAAACIGAGIIDAPKPLPPTPSVGAGDVAIGVGGAAAAIGVDQAISSRSPDARDGVTAAVPAPAANSPARSDTLRNPARSSRGGARCRCKAATNAEGGAGQRLKSGSTLNEPALLFQTLRERRAAQPTKILALPTLSARVSIVTAFALTMGELHGRTTRNEART